MPVWSLLKCHLAMLTNKLLSALNATEVLDALANDLKRHKCIAEREKPIHKQRGAIECQTCKKYFRSKKGYAIHKCVNIHGKKFL